MKPCIGAYVSFKPKADMGEGYVVGYRQGQWVVLCEELFGNILSRGVVVKRFNEEELTVVELPPGKKKS